VKRASLFLHVNNPSPEYFLSHVSVSTVPTDWVEGSERAKGEHDLACLLWPGPRTRKWGWLDDRDILGSVFGNAGTVTSVAIAKNRGEQWYELPVGPRVVDAMRKDQPGGIILHDEMIYRVGGPANIFLESREQAGGAFAPYLEVVYTVEDRTAPSAPAIISEQPGPYPGSVVMKIQCGGDDGDKGAALGFDVQAVEGGPMTGTAPSALPRYMIPRPKESGTEVIALFEGLKAGSEYTFWISAYDEAGNRSLPVQSRTVRTCEAEPRRLAAFRDIELPKGGPLDAGNVFVYAVDGLAKVDPVSGAVLGGDADSRAGSHVYNGAEKRVELFGARGEIIGINLVIELKAAAPARVSITPGHLNGGNGRRISADAFRLHRVIYASVNNRLFGEVAVPDAGPYGVPGSNPETPGQKNQMVAVDLYVPRDAAPGDYTGEIVVDGGAGKAALPVHLKVYHAAIPDEMTFYVELNAYGQSDKSYFHAVHRLAHLHRLGYNVLSYSHSGRETLPVVPRVEGTGKKARVADWSRWDDWMSPLLDGSLFADMPRRGVPIPHFYLPFYENWPVMLHDHYTAKELANRPPVNDKAAYEAWCMKFAKEAPLIEDALDADWIDGNAAVAAEFRRRFEEKGWTRTEFQVFLNNKYYKGDLSYWTLDEPSAGHDFRALAFINNASMKALAGSNVEFAARSDVSRPEHQGDRMDYVPNNLLNMSGGYHNYAPLCRRFMVKRDFRTWLYGGGSGADADNTALDALIVKSWLMGADGCMPYWTSFSGDNEWTGGAELRQVYPGNRHGYSETVVGCLRMFAMRRGQLDCELLNLLAARPGWDRWAAGRSVLAHLDLGGELKARGADDPGRISFRGVTPAKLAALRRALLEELSR